jgi:hypothetical protein
MRGFPAKHHLRYDAAFQSEWKIARIPQDRHLEEVAPLDKWNMVDPLGQAVEIPHFPESKRQSPSLRGENMWDSLRRTCRETRIRRGETQRRAKR